MRIYTKLVADLFHFGHVRFLKEARFLGSHLTVCVVPDERVGLAKRAPFLTTDERKEVVAACRWVDEVITDGPKIITLDFMKKNQFDLYVFAAKDDLEYNQKLLDCQDLPGSMIRRLDYTAGISSTDVVGRIRQRFCDN
jgi:cytidyltransferase-like protein